MSKPKADILNIGRDYQFVSLYLMNFMLHIMLDATGVVPRVHCKSINVMFYFYKVEYVQYLGEVDIFHTSVKTFIPLYNSGKIIKNRPRFSKVMINNVLPPFCGSQCTIRDTINA